MDVQRSNLVDHLDLTTGGTPSASFEPRLDALFGTSEDLIPLWIAEPYVPLANPVVEAISRRASEGWYGYEIRPDALAEAFWQWMERRHGWSGSDLHTEVSPSIGSSLWALIDDYTDEGDGIILQGPVFTDFKPSVRRNKRTPVRNSLLFADGRYTMDLAGLEEAASHESTRMLILCNPHNPVGRLWAPAELAEVARICAENEVMVVADEVHGDLAIPPGVFTPFGSVAVTTGVRWAALQGAIKTFALAGVADSLLITDDEQIADRFRRKAISARLNRNNVFSIAGQLAGYREGDEWVDWLMSLVKTNLDAIREGLPDKVSLVEPEATYLAWLDFRELGLDVPELTRWLVEEAQLALSPGHWFGREGAGFARMTIAADTELVAEAVDRIKTAVRT